MATFRQKCGHTASGPPEAALLHNLITRSSSSSSSSSPSSSSSWGHLRRMNGPKNLKFYHLAKKNKKNWSKIVEGGVRWCEVRRISGVKIVESLKRPQSEKTKWSKHVTFELVFFGGNFIHIFAHTHTQILKEREREIMRKTEMLTLRERVMRQKERGNETERLFICVCMRETKILTWKERRSEWGIMRKRYWEERVFVRDKLREIVREIVLKYGCNNLTIIWAYEKHKVWGDTLEARRRNQQKQLFRLIR